MATKEDAAMATVNGTDQGETLTGTTGADTINGYDGEDVINGLGGADTIDSVDRPTNLFAGAVAPKRDVVNAGGGADFVTGGRLDQLDGGAGRDTLLLNFNFAGPVAGSATPITLVLDASGTGTASDGTSITGFEQVVFFLSDTGDNDVNTGNVIASISSGLGNDRLTTGSADDVVSGGGGNDVISTGDGDDQITGGDGDDQITGGAGDDTLRFAIATDGTDRVDLGTGADTVSFERYDGGSGNIRLTFTSSEVGNGNAVDGGAMANQDGGLAVRVQAEDANGALTGAVSRFDDEGTTFVAGTQGITFDVRDLVSGTARGDTFEGVVLGTSGGDTLSFFPPFREGQNFYYNGGAGDDRVLAGSGNDFLVGGAGDDTLLGGAGNDSFIAGGGNDDIVGGDGVDTVIYGAATGAITVRLSTNLQQATGDGTDRLRGIENVTGSNQADTLIGNSGDNVLNGGAGDDSLRGQDGADVLVGGAGLDGLRGDGGADIFRFALGDTGATKDTADRVLDFSSADGDRIDLSLINATGEAGSSFTVVERFSATAGELVIQNLDGRAFIFGDTDGDFFADLAIAVVTPTPLSAGDIVL
jgi:Ca2+-binding RTX toxin-like protein